MWSSDWPVVQLSARNVFSSVPSSSLTGYGTVSKDGTLLDSFRVRAVKALKGLGGMFFKKSEYKDEEDNLLK